MTLMPISMEMVKVENEHSYSCLLACRVCLAWDLKTYHILDSGLTQLFTDVTGTSVTASDGLPQHICSWCYTLLLKAGGLRARSRRADMLLRRAMTDHQIITNSYIRTIDRSAHKLAHTLSFTLNTNIQYEQDSMSNITDQPSTETIKDEMETKDSALNNKVEKTDIDILQIDVLDNDIEAFDINCDSDTDDSDEEAKMNLKEWKMENVNTKPTLSEVQILESTLDKGPKRRAKDTLSKRRNLKSKKVKNSDEVKTEIDKEKDSEPSRITTIEEIGQFVKKYNFEMQFLTDEEMAEDMERRRTSDRYKYCKFKCDMCYRGFLTTTTFDNHMKKDHDPSNAKNECRLCRVSYRYGFYLKQHVQNAHRLRLRCKECGEGVWGRKECVAHAERHAGATQQCKHCGKHFLKKSSYTWHMRAAHPVENSARGSCELCGEIYTSAKGLRAHKLMVHSQRASPGLQCARCRTQFDNEIALKKHKEQQVNGKCDLNLSPCARCGATLAGAEALLRHLRARHRVDIFTCDLCNRSFLSKPSLSTHIDRVHLGIRPPQHHQLKQYKRVRPRGKRGHDHMCELCGKAYTTHQFLKNHQMMHTGERPFKCDRCPKGFTTAVALTWHTRSHTGERPYQCDQCHQAFSLGSNLNRHRMAVHLGIRKNVPCPRCEKTFSANSTMKLHVRTVHEGAPWPRRDRKQRKPQIAV